MLSVLLVTIRTQVRSLLRSGTTRLSMWKAHVPAHANENTRVEFVQPKSHGTPHECHSCKMENTLVHFVQIKCTRTTRAKMIHTTEE